MTTHRKYITFNPAKGYPAGADLFYECLRCGETIPSRPADSTHCKCRNIMVDVDYGRLSIEDHDKARLFRAKNWKADSGLQKGKERTP